MITKLQNKYFDKKRLLQGINKRNLCSIPCMFISCLTYIAGQIAMPILPKVILLCNDKEIRHGKPALFVSRFAIFRPLTCQKEQKNNLIQKEKILFSSYISLILHSANI